MDNDSERRQIGQFAELVGLSIPQLRRYDRLRLLEPDGRETQSGYRYYTRGQTGAARTIALLRSMDMPIADIRRILTGAVDAERRQLFRDHHGKAHQHDRGPGIRVPGSSPHVPDSNPHVPGSNA